MVMRVLGNKVLFIMRCPVQIALKVVGKTLVCIFFVF